MKNNKKTAGTAGDVTIEVVSFLCSTKEKDFIQKEKIDNKFIAENPDKILHTLSVLRSLLPFLENALEKVVKEKNKKND